MGPICVVICLPVEYRTSNVENPGKTSFGAKPEKRGDAMSSTVRRTK